MLKNMPVIADLLVNFVIVLDEISRAVLVLNDRYLLSVIDNNFFRRLNIEFIEKGNIVKRPVSNGKITCLFTRAHKRCVYTVVSIWFCG